ncbi:GIY-YIG nuclease family protein [Candidatus Parcubacteria bacterium]|nr:GIY-YIG nuclease family protein [Candidatus Parcubacteria bacterium]
MFYVYIIRHLTTQRLYSGSTNDLARRLAEHRARGEFQLVYHEAYRAEADARRREHNLKYFGRAYGQLKRRIQQSLAPS